MATIKTRQRKDGRLAYLSDVRAKRDGRIVHREPRKIVTDKLRSYGVAHRDLIPDTIHDTGQYANNRAELSHQPTRVRERVMCQPRTIGFFDCVLSRLGNTQLRDQ